MWWDKSTIAGKQEVTAITFLNEVFVDKNVVNQDWTSFEVLVGPNDKDTGRPTQTVKLDSRRDYSELRTLCVHAIGTAVDYLLTTEDDLDTVLDGGLIRQPVFSEPSSSAAASNVRPVPSPNERQGDSYSPEFTAEEQKCYPLFRQETDDSAVEDMTGGLASMRGASTPQPAPRGGPPGSPVTGQESVEPRGALARAFGAFQRRVTPNTQLDSNGSPVSSMEKGFSEIHQGVAAARQGTVNSAASSTLRSSSLSRAAPDSASHENLMSHIRSALSQLDRAGSALGTPGSAGSAGSAGSVGSVGSAASAGSADSAGSASPQGPQRWYSTSPHIIEARQHLDTARRLLTQGSPYPVYSLADLSFKSILPTPDNRYQTRRYESNVSPSVSIRECYAIGAYLRTNIDWQSWSKQLGGNRRRKLMLPQHKDDANAGGALTTSRVQAAYAYVNESDALEIVVWTAVRPDTIYSIVASPHLEWSGNLAKHKAELLVSPYDDRLLHKAVHVMRLVASRTHTFKVVDGTFSTISPDPLQSFLIMPRLVGAMAQIIRTPLSAGPRAQPRILTATSLEHGALSALYIYTQGRNMSADQVFDRLHDEDDESKEGAASTGQRVTDSAVLEATGIAKDKIIQYTNQTLHCYTFGSTFIETTDEGRRHRDYTDISSVFSSTTTIDAEYRKYCNPSAEEIRSGDVMSAAIDAAKLLCLTQVIEKHCVSTREHFTRRMLSRAHQMIGSRETDDMMRLMRSMQIGDEFDRYFTIPTSRSSVSLLRTNFNIMTSSMSDLSNGLYKFTGCLPVAQ